MSILDSKQLVYGCLGSAAVLAGVFNPAVEDSAWADTADIDISPADCIRAYTSSSPGDTFVHAQTRAEAEEELACAQKEYERTGRELALAQDRLRAAQTKLTQAARTYDQLQAEALEAWTRSEEEQLEDRILQAQDELHACEREYESLHAKEERLTAQKHELEQECASLKDQIAQLEKQAQEQGRDYVGLTQDQERADSLCRDISAKNDELSRLQAERARDKQELDAFYTQATPDVHELVATMEAMDAAEKELERKKKDIEEGHRWAQQIEDDLEKPYSRWTAEDLAETQAEIERFEQELPGLEEAYEREFFNYLKMSDAFVPKGSRLVALIQNIHRLDGLIDQLEQEQAGLQSQYDELAAHVESQTADLHDLVQAEAALANAQERLGLVQDELRCLSEEKDGVEARQTQLKHTVARLEEERHLLQTNPSHAFAVSHDRKLAEARAHVDQAREAVDLATREVDQMQDDWDARKAARDEAHVCLRQATTHKQQADERYAQALHQAQEDNRDVSAYFAARQTYEHTKDKLAQLEAMIAEKQALQQRIAANCEHLNAEGELFYDEHKHVEAQIGETESKLSDVYKELYDAEDLVFEIEQLEQADMTDEQRSRYAEYKQLTAKLEAEISRLETHHAFLEQRKEQGESLAFEFIFSHMIQKHIQDHPDALEDLFEHQRIALTQQLEKDAAHLASLDATYADIRDSLVAVEQAETRINSCTSMCEQCEGALKSTQERLDALKKHARAAQDVFVHAEAQLKQVLEAVSVGCLAEASKDKLAAHGHAKRALQQAQTRLDQAQADLIHAEEAYRLACARLSWAKAQLAAFDLSFLQGENLVVEQGSGMEFIIDCPIQGFSSLYIDGSPLDHTLYEVTQGSTRIRVQPCVSQDLQLGAHCIAAHWQNGALAQTRITLVPAREKADQVGEGTSLAGSDRQGSREPELADTSLASVDMSPAAARPAVSDTQFRAHVLPQTGEGSHSRIWTSAIGAGILSLVTNRARLKRAQHARY